MKKAIIAITLLLLSGVGGFFGYRYYQDKKMVDMINSNVWTVNEMSNLKLVEMTIDNDSLFTDALYALLEKKVEDKNLQASIDIKIKDTSIDLNKLKKMLIKISNGTTEVSDSLIITKKAPHTIIGRLEFNAGEIDTTENGRTNVIQLLEDLYTRNNLQVSIHPYFNQRETSWIKISIPEAKTLVRPVVETPIETNRQTDSSTTEEIDTEEDLD